MRSLEEIRALRDQHESSLPGSRWFTPQQLAERWAVSAATVRAIPAAQLRYKEFGQGQKLRRRRYMEAWVRAYEERTGRGEAAA